MKNYRRFLSLFLAVIMVTALVAVAIHRLKVHAILVHYLVAIAEVELVVPGQSSKVEFESETAGELGK